MIHDCVELHNVAELHYEARRGGHRLQRVPEVVRNALNPGAQLCVLQPDNAEIRYVASGPSKVTLSSHGQTRVSVFFGAFDSYQRDRRPRTADHRDRSRRGARSPPRPLHRRHAVLTARGAARPGRPGARSGAAARGPRRGHPPAGGGRAAVTAPAHLRHLDHPRLLRRGPAPDLRGPGGAPPGRRPDQPGCGRLRTLRAGVGRLHGGAYRLARRQPGPVGEHAGLPDAGVPAAGAVPGRPRPSQRVRRHAGGVPPVAARRGGGDRTSERPSGRRVPSCSRTSAA